MLQHQVLSRTDLKPLKFRSGFRGSPDRRFFNQLFDLVKRIIAKALDIIGDVGMFGHIFPNFREVDNLDRRGHSRNQRGFFLCKILADFVVVLIDNDVLSGKIFGCRDRKLSGACTIGSAHCKHSVVANSSRVFFALCHIDRLSLRRVCQIRQVEQQQFAFWLLVNDLPVLALNFPVDFLASIRLMRDNFRSDVAAKFVIIAVLDCFGGIFLLGGGIFKSELIKCSADFSSASKAVPGRAAIIAIPEFEAGMLVIMQDALSHVVVLVLLGVLDVLCQFGGCIHNHFSGPFSVSSSILNKSARHSLNSFLLQCTMLSRYPRLR